MGGFLVGVGNGRGGEGREVGADGGVGLGSYVSYVG